MACLKWEFSSVYDKLSLLMLVELLRLCSMLSQLRIWTCSVGLIYSKLCYLYQSTMFAYGYSNIWDNYRLWIGNGEILLWNVHHVLCTSVNSCPNFILCLISKVIGLVCLDDYALHFLIRSLMPQYLLTVNDIWLFLFWRMHRPSTIWFSSFTKDSEVHSSMSFACIFSVNGMRVPVKTDIRWLSA